MPKNLIPGDATIRAIRPGDPRKRLNDGNGLFLLLFAKTNGGKGTGAHGWRYSYTCNGARKTLSLGTYPATGLSLARRLAEEARQQLAAGTDPSEARKERKAAREVERMAQLLEDAGLPGPGTFEHVAREWLSTVHQAKVSGGHAERTRIRFEQDAFPWIGRQPIDAIEPPELLAVLRRVLARGAIETAHRLKDACGQVFRYGIATGACQRNPAADLRDALPPVPTRHHAAIVTPDQAGELLRNMADYPGHPVTRIALQLSALLFLRPGELRQAEWAWVDFEGAMLTLPPALMKRRKDAKRNGPPHLVPLAPQVLALLRELQALTGGGRYCFPAIYTGERSMSENTVNLALRRMGYDRETMTAHGFRAMARTLAAERLGVAPEVIEAQLAHEVSDALGTAYNRAQYLDQRRELMMNWANYLERLRDGAQVVRLSPRRAA